jgi:hypothetical protein
MRSRRSRRAIVLLWLGVAALALHALVGTAHLGARGAGDSLVFEICGDVGAGPDEAVSPELLQSEAPDHANEMRCCDLCGVRGIAMIGDLDPRTAPMPAFQLVEARAPPPDGGAPRTRSTLTPIIPRAPPRIA